MNNIDPLVAAFQELVQSGATLSAIADQPELRNLGFNAEGRLESIKGAIARCSSDSQRRRLSALLALGVFEGDSAQKRRNSAAGEQGWDAYRKNRLISDLRDLTLLLQAESSSQTSAELYVVTGMSGIGLRSTLPRLQAKLSNTDLRFFEDYLTAPASILSEQLLLGPVNGVRNVFQLPEAALHEASHAALRAAAEDINNLRGSGRNVLLSIHTAWYHANNQGFIPSIKPSDFVNMVGAPDFVLNIIDDIYDIFIRLSRQDEFFHPSTYTNYREAGVPPPLSSALMKILQWRELEWRLSELLARESDARYALVAAKHPIETFVRLLQSDNRVVYISHPISAPRRLGITAAGRPLVDQIARLSGTLCSGPDVCLIEPTAIDELRFDSEHSAQLTPRWPLSGEPTMWDELEGLERIMSEQPFVQPEGHQDLLPEQPNYKRERDRLNQQAQWHAEDNSTIRALAAAINQQINWRDRVLVAQSELLFVYNPYSRSTGKISGGVAIEIDLHKQLTVIGSLSLARRSPRLAAFVNLPPLEELARQCAAVTQVIQNQMNNGIIQVSPYDRATIAELTDLIRHYLIGEVDVTSWKSLDETEVGQNVQSLLEDPTQPWSSALAFSSEMRERSMGQGHLWAARSSINQAIGAEVKLAIERGPKLAGSSVGSHYSLEWFDDTTCVRDMNQYQSMSELAQAVFTYTKSCRTILETNSI